MLCRRGHSLEGLITCAIRVDLIDLRRRRVQMGPLRWAKMTRVKIRAAFTGQERKGVRRFGGIADG